MGAPTWRFGWVIGLVLVLLVSESCDPATTSRPTASASEPTKRSDVTSAPAALASSASPHPAGSVQPAPVPAALIAPEDELIADLVSLRPSGDEPGQLEGLTSSRQRRLLRLATRAQPRPHRQALTFYRLARALGLTAVAWTAARRVALSQLARLLPREALDSLRPQAVIANDGTVTALVQQLPDGTTVPTGDVDQVADWARAVATVEAPAAGLLPLLRGYVEMLVLDYLTANLSRRTLVLDESRRRVWLVDNHSAFTSYVTAGAHSELLERLKPVIRYPRGLRDALWRLTEPRLKAELNQGRYEDRLLGPRQLADLVERRATLLTLLEARILQYGEAVVLSL